MYKDVTDYPNQDLMDLHSAGWLLFDIPHNAGFQMRPTDTLPWSNTEWAYDERRRQGSCRLYINLEE